LVIGETAVVEKGVLLYHGAPSRTVGWRLPVSLPVPPKVTP
jgi:serine acetyltransferase